jgi:hypothetical protein
MGVEAIPAKDGGGTGEEGSAIWLMQQDSAQTSRQKIGTRPEHRRGKSLCDIQGNYRFACSLSCYMLSGLKSGGRAMFECSICVAVWTLMVVAIVGITAA